MFCKDTMNIIQSNNLHYMQGKKALNNKLLSKQGFYEQNLETKNNTTRPTQAVSFGGSAVSMAQSSGEKISHKLINFVYENEAAYTAIYSLIFAGILKPMCVLRMPGSEDKDKQIVATKNFLQAFIGSFLSLTVGGGFVKKAIDVVTNNLDLIKENKTKTGYEVLSMANKDDAKKISNMALASLKKEKTGFKTKYRFIKDQGVSAPSAIWQALTKKGIAGTEKPKGFDPDKQIFINITDSDIKSKAKELIKTAREHLPIFNNPKHVSFIKELKENGNEKLLLQRKKELLDLVAGGKASKEAISENCNSFLKTILDNTVTGEKGNIKSAFEKVTAALNDKKGFSDALNTFFDFAKDKRASETLMDTYKSTWKQSTGWITAISKAKVSSILLPTVMAVLFAKRNAQKAQKEQERKNTSLLQHSKTFNEEKNTFKAFANNTKQPSFTGGFVDTLAKGVEKISTSGFGESIVKGMHKLPRPFNKTSARMGDIESGIITAYWVQNTARSKKIDPDQKLGLNVHTVLVTLVSSACAFLIDTALDPVIGKCKKNYSKTLEDSAKTALKTVNPNEASKVLQEGCKNLLGNSKAVKDLSEAIKGKQLGDLFNEAGEMLKDTELTHAIDDLVKTYGKKLTKFKSLTVFTAVVRFLVPVLMVPISGKLKQKIKEAKKEKEAQQTNAKS